MVKVNKGFRKSHSAALVIAAIISSQASAAETKNTTATDTMVVTASGFQQRIQDSAASISVVTREQIENKAYRDITDALKDVPGVVVTGGGSHSANSQTKCNKVTHRSGTDKIAVLTLSETLLHEGKTFDSA